MGALRVDLSKLFDEALFVANRLMGNQAPEDALTVLTLAAENTAFGDVRMMACANCAIVSAQLGRLDDALAWYDRAMDIEAAHPTRFAARRKVALLAEAGRAQDSLALCLELLAGPLQSDDAKWVRATVASLDAAAP
jgi:Tfp pilus assembly protein PilF